MRRLLLICFVMLAAGTLAAAFAMPRGPEEGGRWPGTTVT